MDYRLLGPIEIVWDDRPLTIGGAKQRALLLDLLLHANHVVPSEQLLEDLWGASTHESTSHELQVYVSRLRRLLRDATGDGDVLVTRPSGYELLLQPRDTVDADRFEHFVHEGRELLGRDPAAALERFDRALSLWRGPAFGDLSTEPFASGSAERLEDLRRSTLEDRLQAMLDLGRHADVTAEAHTLIAEYPLRERLWGQLMLALYRCGRQAEALQAYQDARERLSDELGIDPGPELTRLHERILAQDPSLLTGSRMPAEPVIREPTDGAPIGPVGTAVSRTAEPEHAGAGTADAPHNVRRIRLDIVAGVLLTSILVGLVAVARTAGTTRDSDSGGTSPGGQADPVSTLLRITTDTVLAKDHYGAIVIAADDVTLDCAGFDVIGPDGVTGAEGRNAGILVEGWSGVLVMNCSVTGFPGSGILIAHTWGTRLVDNEATGNSDSGFVFVGVEDALVEGNVARENGPAHWVGEDEAAIDGASGADGMAGNEGMGFLVVGSGGNRFVGNHAGGNAGNGFFLQSSDRNLLKGNESSANHHDGMYLMESRRNHIVSNRLVGNGADTEGHGIFLEFASSFNVLRDNEVLRSGTSGIPITEGSDWNTVEGNTSSRNVATGFDIIASHNTFLDNIAVANGGFGFRIADGVGNEMSSNEACGSGIRDAVETRTAGDNVWAKNDFCTGSI